MGLGWTKAAAAPTCKGTQAMMTDNLRRTAFSPLYEEDVTEWEEVMGYRMPTTVAGLDTEYRALRNTVVAQDYSMLYKWFVEGPTARTVVD
jgi:glycine cleavage system aminomethyltransferase T